MARTGSKTSTATNDTAGAGAGASDPGSRGPAATPDPARRRREEFFFHPEILLGRAGYRHVTSSPPAERPGT